MTMPGQGLGAFPHNPYVPRRSEDEINAVLNAAAVAGGPSCTEVHLARAEGVQAALEWVFGMTDDNPMEGQ